MRGTTYRVSNQNVTCVFSHDCLLQATLIIYFINMLPENGSFLTSLQSICCSLLERITISHTLHEQHCCHNMLTDYNINRVASSTCGIYASSKHANSLIGVFLHVSCMESYKRHTLLSLRMNPVLACLLILPLKFIKLFTYSIQFVLLHILRCM